MPRTPAVLVLGILLLVPAAQGLPTGTQDDAGSGGDAGDHPPIATPISPGNHTGELASRVDTVDYYTFRSPGAAMLRVEVEARVDIGLVLVDPSGEVRDETFFPGPSVAVDAIGAPAGNWTLGVHLEDRNALFLSVPYDLRVSVEEHDEVVRLEAGPGETLVQEFPDGGFTALTVETAPDPAPAGEPRAFAPYIELDVEEGYLFGTGILRFESLTNPDAVWTRGTVDAGASPGEVVTLPSSPSAGGFRLGFETVTQDAFGGVERVVLGARATHGVTTEGWLLTDANASPEWRPGTTADFRTLQDCEGGQGFQAGPYATLEDATCTVETTTDTSVALFDAEHPPYATEVPDVVLDAPHREPRQIGGSEVFLPFADWETGTLNPQGNWTSDVGHLDGREDGRHRFVAASFPVENPFVRFNLTAS